MLGLHLQTAVSHPYLSVMSPWKPLGNLLAVHKPERNHVVRVIGVGGLWAVLSVQSQQAVGPGGLYPSSEQYTSSCLLSHPSPAACWLQCHLKPGEVSNGSSVIEGFSYTPSFEKFFLFFLPCCFLAHFCLVCLKPSSPLHHSCSFLGFCGSFGLSTTAWTVPCLFSPLHLFHRQNSEVDVCFAKSYVVLFQREILARGFVVCRALGKEYCGSSHSYSLSHKKQGPDTQMEQRKGSSLQDLIIV